MGSIHFQGNLVPTEYNIKAEREKTTALSMCSSLSFVKGKNPVCACKYYQLKKLKYITHKLKIE